MFSRPVHTEMTSTTVYRALLAFVLAALMTLIGCTDNFTGSEGLPAPGVSVSTPGASGSVGNKLRHANLLDRATENRVAGKGENQTGLLFALEPQAVLERYGTLDRYAVLERYATVERYGVLERYDYEYVFPGFAVWVNTDQLDSLLTEMNADPEIAWVEPDIYLKHMPMQLAYENGGLEVLPWGAVRIGATGHPVTDVDLYVIDTGVTNDDLNLVESIDFRDPTETPVLDPADYDGHGTHVAGLAAAIHDTDGIAGVAAGARVHSLKVINGDESGDDAPVELASVVAAVEYVTGAHMAAPNQPMVVNMSLGTDIGTAAYNALDDAIRASIANGVTYVIAAGNYGTDAETVTPAHVTEAITVGAYDVLNKFASFSNHGATVDILAPGTNLISLPTESAGPSEQFVLISGTSQAAALVSGAVTAFLSAHPNASPAQVHSALIESSAPGILAVPAGTTTRSVDLPAFLGMEVPPFMQYAILSGNDLTISNEIYVGIESEAPVNANVFSNKNVSVTSESARIEGFGYFGGSITGAYANVFTPRYNPSMLSPAMQAAPIQVPSFNAADYALLATETHVGDLYLSGHYFLGTYQHPSVIYVGGSLKTVGPVTFSGYGVFITKKDIVLSHPVTTEVADGTTTLGLYSSNNLKMQAQDLKIAAHLFANHDIVMASNAMVYGNLTAGNNIKFTGPATIYYRSTSPALTELFWPMSGQ